jgi:hypothetical protein
MNTRKRIQCNFRPCPENHQRLADADTIGLNVSDLINEVLKDHLGEALKRKSEKLQAMVRGGGFEPPTPTVSR